VLRLLELHVGLIATAPAAAAAELSNNDGRSRTKHEWTSAQHRPLAPFFFALFDPRHPSGPLSFVENIPLRKNRANFRS
jgi:hypothetical protein